MLENIEDYPFSWPLLIKYATSDDVMPVQDANDWRELANTAGWLLGQKDRLIDVEGDVWEVLTSSGQQLQAVNKGKIELTELVEYVKGHMHAKGVCCISKFNLSSYRDAHAAIIDAESL